MVLPLLKKPGLDRIYNNYRPVSNLPYVSKLVEKAALDQFNHHCNTKQLMPDYQSAYRASYSTETALLRFHHDILQRMENQQITSFVALDLSAAFDTVHHEVLLRVLESSFGIRSDALSWFDSYLRPRCFSVQVPGAVSSSRDITFSVPQGSCLGPVLFSAYSSTLSDVIPREIGIRGYADDTGLDATFAPGSENEKSAHTSLEHCCHDIIEWMNNNRLKINTAKTEFLYFGARQQLCKCVLDSITVGNSQVPRSHSVKYLGVKIDEELNFKDHVSNKSRLAMANLQKIRTIRNYLSVDLCKQVVIAMVISHLDYANSLYNGLPKCTIEKLQRVQNIAAKVVLGRKKRDSSMACLVELHWLPVAFRIQYKLCMLVYKCLTNSAPDYLISLIKKRISRPGLRSASDELKLHPPKVCRETFLKRSFAYSGPYYWNTLPLTVRACTSLETFKSRLKTHLFSVAFKDIL